MLWVHRINKCCDGEIIENKTVSHTLKGFQADSQSAQSDTLEIQPNNPSTLFIASIVNGGGLLLNLHMFITESFYLIIVLYLFL